MYQKLFSKQFSGVATYQKYMMFGHFFDDKRCTWLIPSKRANEAHAFTDKGMYVVQGLNYLAKQMIFRTL